MPSQICDKSGTKLISSAGGSLDAKYHDALDSSGESNIFSLSSNGKSPQYSSQPMLNNKEIIRPSKGNTEDIILSGNIPNHKVGTPLTIILVKPDGVTQTFPASLTVNGDYKGMISINDNSLTGTYGIQLSHNNADVGFTSFIVLHQSVPESIKDKAKRWSTNIISDSEFGVGLEDLIDKGIIKIPSTAKSLSDTIIPEWLKTTAKWWSNNELSDDEFLSAIEFLAKKGIIRI
jgi:hypothetical protein